MIEATRRWFKRNRTNLAIGAGLLGVGYLAGQYVLSKVSEARQRMNDDRIAKENLRRRFSQNQQDCTFTVLALLPTAADHIIEALPVEKITNELQKQKAERLARSAVTSEPNLSDSQSGPQSAVDNDGKSLKSFQSESFVHASQIADSTGQTGDGSSASSQQPKRNRAELWNEMKISSIARAFTLIYTLALLTLLTRIQLNLLGRRNYLSSVISLASPAQKGAGVRLENRDDDNFDETYGNDFETNRKYLTFSWWILHQGCKDIMEKVLAAVKDAFGSVNPREELTLERLSELILSVRKKVEGATESERRANQWLPYLLPSQDKEEYVLVESGMSLSRPDAEVPVAPLLRRLLDETSDLIESPTFSHVLTLVLDAAFSLLVDNKIAIQAYGISPSSVRTGAAPEIVDIDAKAKLANTLAVFCRQAHSIGSGGSFGSSSEVGGGNEYLQTMESVRELEAFAAVIYSSNFEFEAPETEPADYAHIPSPSTRPTTGGTADAPEQVSDSAGAEATPQRTGEDASFVKDESEFESAWNKAATTEQEISAQSEGIV